MKEPRKIYCVYCKHCKTIEYDDYDGDAGCTNKCTFCDFFNKSIDFIDNLRSDYYCKGYEE